MHTIRRNEPSEIQIPLEIDPDETYTITLKNKLTCKETAIEQQGDTCGTIALFSLNTDADCGEYWITIGEYTSTLMIQ